MAETPVLLTRTEFDEHQRELVELRDRRQNDLPRLLREARGFVSTDANEEITALREDFAFVERRIAALEELLRHAAVADDDGPTDVVRIGAGVTFEYVGTGRTVTCVLAGTGGGGAGTVSAGSPVGRALLGRRAGDVVAVELPRRTETIRVIAVG